MTRLAKSYERAIKKELNCHGAWMPIVNTLKVGDYGYFEGGVFRPLGNVKNKYSGINLNVQQGPPASIDFTSDGTRTFKLDAGGNVVDNFAGLGNGDASLKFEFTKENSVVIKAKTITVDQLQNIDEVAAFLASKDSWRRKYKVISATYTANNSLVVCSKEANSDFTINAKANLLKAADVGEVAAGLETSSSKSSTFESTGDSGVLAISLFKVSWIGGKPRFLTTGNVEDLDIQNDFSGELEDDY